MKDIKAKILYNENIAQSYFRMGIASSFIARTARPGQFVQIRCSDGSAPLLRRPFGVHRIGASGKVEILYDVVGRGTEIISTKQKGETIDILGPLGNGFTLPRTTEYRRRNTVLVAGGIGVAPLVFLAERLKEIQNPRSEIQTVVLLGAKTKKMILCEKDFKKAGAKVYIATDDGSRGYKGVVSNLLRNILRNTDDDIQITVYACGPDPMLRCTAGICREEKLGCQVLVEEKMACGIGACLGCAVKVTGHGYKLGCKDGPVFNADDIIWESG